MATFVVPHCVLHAGTFRRLGLAEDCTSSGRPDCTGIRVRASSGSGGNSSADDEQVERARRALKSLDQQLNTLSQSNGRVPRTPQPLRTLPGPDTEGGKVQWPEFDESFLLYTAGFLFLLTIANNLVFNFIFKPDVQPKKPLFPKEESSVMEEETRQRRFRIRSFQEQNAPAESPALTDRSP